MHAATDINTTVTMAMLSSSGTAPYVVTFGYVRDNARRGVHYLKLMDDAEA